MPEPLGEAPASVERAAMSARPIAEPERIDSLDLLRGFAILGIFLVNIQFFSMPLLTAIMSEGLSEEPVLDQISWAFVKTFCEFKFVSLFSLLFGAGLVMQLMRSKRWQGGFGRRYARRIVILFLFGLIHTLVFWYGDILLLYAVMGGILVVFRNLQAKTLLRIAGGLVIFILFIQTTCAGLELAFGSMKESGAQDGPSEQVEETSNDGITDVEPSGAEQVSEQESPSSDEEGAWRADHPALGHLVDADFFPFTDEEAANAYTRGEIIAYRDGPFIDAVIYRAVTYGWFLMFSIVGLGWHVLAMFLIGAALMKLDFFSPAQAGMQKRLAVLGLSIGLPIELVHTACQYFIDDLFLKQLISALLHEIGPLMLCLGYTGTLCLIASSVRTHRLHHPIRAVGRMALTTYLGSTLIATFLMYHWGLGWFNSVGRFDQLMIVLITYVGLMVASSVWLMIFRFGPFEWLWRTLTYMKRQPILRPR